MNYYVVNTCPTNNGKRIETGHLGIDMILRCDTYEQAWGYCKKYAHEMVKNDPDMRVYSFDENQPGGGSVEVLKNEWIEEENEYCDIIYASFCVFAIDHFFAGGKMDCLTKDGKMYEHHSYEKPTEWSEEDEKIRKTLLDYYEKALDNYTCVEWLNGITYGELCDWLKSLRPQPHWKPSEEQMNALKVVARGFPTDDPDAIDSLLTDLQNYFSL